MVGRGRGWVIDRWWVLVGELHGTCVVLLGTELFFRWHIMRDMTHISGPAWRGLLTICYAVNQPGCALRTGMDCIFVYFNV